MADPYSSPPHPPSYSPSDSSWSSSAPQQQPIQQQQQQQQPQYGYNSNYYAQPQQYPSYQQPYQQPYQQQYPQPYQQHQQFYNNHAMSAPTDQPEYTAVPSLGAATSGAPVYVAPVTSNTSVTPSITPQPAYGSAGGSTPGAAPGAEDFTQPGKLGVLDIDTAYRARPSNGHYFGPYLRYGNIDLQTATWYGSVMVVVESETAPYLQIHPSSDLQQMRAVEPFLLYQYENYRFFRYNLEVPQLQGTTGQFWTYAITHNGQSFTYEFLVAGAQQVDWRFMAFSCADFSLGVKEEERRELGGVGFLWEDTMKRHRELGGLHAMLGGGDQIYADRMWPEIASLQDWMHTKGKQNRKDYEWTPRLEKDLNLAYFFYYTNHFDRPGIRDCFASIPNVFQIDDHDIFDGFGSYPDYMQLSNVFVNIGRIAFDFYLLFQHQTTKALLQQNPDPRDLFTVTGLGWHFLKYLGPECVILGPDTRAERHQKSIIGEQTHQELFRRLEALPPTIKHVVVMLAVPIVYPRLTMVENVLSGVKQTKRAINGAWNILGKGATKVASVVGAEKSTKSGFEGVKKAFGKSGMMSSLVSGFGEIDLLDDLADHWTHENHALERTFFARNLQRIARDKGVRFTFISGDVHLCGIGRFINADDPENYQLMYQVISSAISNVPPPGAVVRLLHNKDKLYLPDINSSAHKTDTKEEMIEFFDTDVDGSKLDLHKLLGRRNYAIGSVKTDGTMTWDLYVQSATGNYGASERTRKYGPLIVPPVTRPAGQQQLPLGAPQQQVPQQQGVPAGIYGPDGIVQNMQSMNVK
ncbi:hypothetical protein BZA70DRAFT_155625 [Myxozyma melibiosi]|uniref:PhoD-like phosphatase domain-containing protein n=1 Tax=Myxozyma melibiosi TaxID=54550 RepID=A0ABR1F6C7_9ASCO